MFTSVRPSNFQALCLVQKAEMMQQHCSENVSTGVLGKFLTKTFMRTNKIENSFCLASIPISREYTGMGYPSGLVVFPEFCLFYIWDEQRDFQHILHDAQ